MKPDYETQTELNVSSGDNETHTQRQMKNEVGATGEINQWDSSKIFVNISLVSRDIMKQHTTSIQNTSNVA